jgi:hypothetical protein
MILDCSWAGGFVVGIQHTDTAVIELEDDVYQFCNAIVISLGFFVVGILFPEDEDDDDDGGELTHRPAHKSA